VGEQNKQSSGEQISSLHPQYFIFTGSGCELEEFCSFIASTRSILKKISQGFSPGLFHIKA